MAYIMAVLPGVGLADFEKMELVELMAWEARAARIDRLRAGVKS